MLPDQLDAIVTLSAPSLSPDGRTAVVAACHASFEADSYVGQLWRVATDGATPPRRITRGVADTAPQYSPDGEVIAFLRKVEGKPQLAIVEARGGEPRVLTDAPLGVSSFSWAPDSARIAFTAAMPEPGRYGTIEGVSPAQESPRRITGNKWRGNGRGYIADKPVGVYVLDVPDDSAPWVEPVGRAAASPLNEERRAERDEVPRRGEGGDASMPSSSAKSQDAGVASQPSAGVLDPATPLRSAQDDSGLEFGQPTIGGAHRLPDSAIESGQPMLGGARGLPEARLVTPPDSDAAFPRFHGEHVYFIAALQEDADETTVAKLYRVPAAGGAEPELVAPARGTETITAFAFAGDALLVFGSDRGPSGTDFVAKLTGIYSADVAGNLTLLTDPETEEFGGNEAFAAQGVGGTLLAPRRDKGADTLLRFAADGTATEVIRRAERILLGAAEAGGTLVVTYSDPTTPGELAVARDGELVTLTNFAQDLPQPVAQTEFTAVGEDGYPVHGWVYLPEGPGPHPVLLNIHGGPFADYSWGYFDEAQAYAAAGYAVVQCNPRGSQGYGRAHGLAIKERMGTVDMQDVLTFLDGAIAEFPELDGGRVGILGGSYGGYLTAWTIAHEHRFAAAIVERGYLDPLAFIGTSDIGWFFSEEYVGRDPEHALTQSPQAVVGQVRTPTLVIHSEEDWRCPPDQAQRYFASLRRAGVETEMLLFPGENHELSRSGTPWHRRERFEAILDWFQSYLPVGCRDGYRRAR